MKMLKRGLLLALCAITLSGCVVYPVGLRVTPPRVDVIGYGYAGGYYNGYDNGYRDHGHHHHHDHY
jgi:hypothetical protein